MSVSTQDLRDTFYDILRETESDSSSYPLDLVDILLNSAQQRICHWRVVNPLNWQEVRKWTLPFLNTDYYYSNVATTSLESDVAVGDTTLTVSDASDFDSSWALYIAGNIITYTGTTATTYTWCSNVLFAFESWQEVSVAFDLPSDYVSVINVIYNNKFKLEAKSYDDVFEDLNKYKWWYYQRNRASSMYGDPYSIPPFYTIKDNGYIIIFNLNETGDMIRLRYEKQPTTLATGIDATIDNDIYAKTTIPYLAVWEMLYNRGEEWRAAEILNFALGQVKEMYNYYNNTSFEKLNWVQYKMWKWKLNI